MNHMDRVYELQVGLYQMMILLLFNKTLCLTVIEMIEESGLTQQDVIRSLKVNDYFFFPPLLCSPLLKPLIDLEVLLCDDRTLQDSSKVNVNTGFTR
jgi:hypothetical protein